MTTRDGAPGMALVRRFPWSLAWLGAPVSPVLREALELRWPWKHGLALDNRRLRALGGAEPHTPRDHAVRAALAG